MPTALERSFTEVAVFASLSLDKTRLLVPHGEFRSLEPVMELQPLPASKTSAQSGNRAIGQIQFADEKAPVYCMDARLNTLNEIPPTRRVGAIMGEPGRYYALLCDTMQPIERSQLQLQPIPDCMQLPNMAFSALAIYQQKLVYVTSDRALSAYLGIGDIGGGE